MGGGGGDYGMSTGMGMGSGGYSPPQMSYEQFMVNSAGTQNPYGPPAVGMGPQMAQQSMPQSQYTPFNPGSGVVDSLNSWKGGAPPGTKDWTKPEFYAIEGQRNLMEGYNNYFATPYFNAEMAARQQAFNEYQYGSNFQEQQRMNTGQMDLAYRGSNREDQALAFGQQNNVRDFGEAQRQFNEQQKLDNMWKTGQLSAQQYANETQRLQANQQFNLGKMQDATQNRQINNQYNISMAQNKIADYEARTGRIDVEGRKQLQQYANETERKSVGNQYALGQAQNANTRFGLENEYALGQAQNTNTRFGLENQYKLGQGQLSNEAYANQAQAKRFEGMTANEAYANQAQAERYRGQTANEQFANQTALTGVQNQYALGQGQLGFQNRELDVNEGFRRSQLAQEADLTRERYKNDLTTARYQTFGRAQQPNFRATRSW